MNGDLYQPGDAERKRADMGPEILRRITKQLREDGWYPRGTYACGCCPQRLCAAHADQRAVDHYDGFPL